MCDDQRKFRLSALMRCSTAISRNDPITLANEIKKVLDNSSSDWNYKLGRLALAHNFEHVLKGFTFH